MYIIHNGLLPELINALYKRNKYINSYNIRSSNLLRVPKIFNELDYGMCNC